MYVSIPQIYVNEHSKAQLIRTISVTGAVWTR